MPRLTYKLLRCKSSRKKRTSQNHDSKKHKKCFSTTDALASSPYKNRSQKISSKERGFTPTVMGPPHTAAKASHSSGNVAANKQRRHVKASKQYRGVKPIEYKKLPLWCPPRRRLWYPVPMGRYSPGTEPVHIPYHLYILVKQVVDITTRFNRSQIRSHLRDMEQVEDKIRFFCLYFYCHLPRGWEYKQDNASSLIAGYDTFFAKDGPRYDLSGYTPFRGKLKSGDDTAKTMSIVHSRKTPTPETFKEWSWLQISFYCQLCSCFGIDYQHLETASEDDVCLMYVGS